MLEFVVAPQETENLRGGILKIPAVSVGCDIGAVNVRYCTIPARQARALARLPKLHTYSHSRASDTRVCVRAAATPAQVSKMNLDGVGGRLGEVEQEKR